MNLMPIGRVFTWDRPRKQYGTNKRATDVTLEDFEGGEYSYYTWQAQWMQSKTVELPSSTAKMINQYYSSTLRF